MALILLVLILAILYRWAGFSLSALRWVAEPRSRTGALAVNSANDRRPGPQMTAPADWQGFAEMSGGASGALTGLLFVAVSLNASGIAHREGLRRSQ